MLLRVGSRGSRLALTAGGSWRRRGCGRQASRSRWCRSRRRATATGRSRSGRSARAGVFVKGDRRGPARREDRCRRHSAKDMTSSEMEGLRVGAYLEREDPRDALCGGERAGGRGDACGDGLGEAESAAALRWSRRSRSSHCAATSTRACASAASVAWTRVVLAACGLDGSGWETRSAGGSRRRRCCRRPAKGALALQVRAGEEELVTAADDGETRRRVEAERAVVFAHRWRVPCAGCCACTTANG
jgi:hydroxymethylbilane synthase